MPRLRQVPRAEAPDGIVPVMYDFIFGDRDPVAEPGLQQRDPRQLVDRRRPRAPS